uniref:ubiquitinyl hydrolase 1 n=1 Tax=Cajanus cajan TaxID=3821 RepID=A0A151TSQ1_CAJCA|nr:Ubiquitin carboxyl-terminal hydrolase 16 [Cajanus cajan]
MRVTGDLGFSSLVLVLLLLIGFVIRRKWQVSEARKDEIKRLLILAAEETARAEKEAFYEYDTALSAARTNQCAVCYFPATARCSQCKSVRYCSFECQTVHWRQGHKLECRPPSTNHRSDDVTSDVGSKVVEQGYSGIHDSNSELSSNSFSGFSASTGSSDSSDDSSVCESIISNEHDRPEGHMFVDPTLDIADNISNDDSMGVTMSSSPKFASLVESVDGFSTKNKLNHIRPGFSEEESKLASNVKASSSMGKTIQPSTAFSGFWDKALDPRGIKDNNIKNDTHSSSSDESMGKKTVSESSFHFSFSTIPPFHTVLGHLYLSPLNPPVLTKNHTLKSSEIRCLTDELADSNLASRTEAHLHSSTTCGNNDIKSETRAVTSSRVASYSVNSKSGLRTSVLKVVDQFRGSNLSKHFPLAVGSDIAGRHDDKGFFSYELFVKLYNLNKVELSPFGLINCGNSCYANAVLQCLAFTPPLTAYLLQGLHSKSCANTKWCFTCEFERLILKSMGTKSPVSPMGIISHLQNIGSQLGNGREEDAHEFLRHVIDTMQSVCLMEAGVNASGSVEQDTTLIGLTFGGYLRSKIKCMKCGGKSERQERMMDLTVEIEGEITTLVEALQRFTSTETLDGENKYHCVRCKSYERAKKKLTVSEAPNVLTVALKRFQSGKFGKLNKPVQFPEILNLAPFMSGTSDKSPIYRLYGVVVHLDVMNAAFSGHYVCYLKNIQNKWFKVDDSVVTPIELERVLTKGAYMLFYARCSPRAPRLVRNRILSPDSKSKVSGKTHTTKARHVSPNSGAAEHVNSSISPDGSPGLESFYSKFHHLKRILEEDSSSDNSSLISSNSDEGSCSTDSTRDSTSTDDLSDYIFGDSGNGWSSLWRNSDSDASSSSSSSPLTSRHSPLSDMDRYDSVSPDAERRGIDVSGLHSNTSLQHRKLDSGRISRNRNSRETDSFLKLGSNHFNDIDSGGVSCRKSRKRTD